MIYVLIQKSSIKVLDRCLNLIDEFAEIKFTLFIPMAYRLVNEEEYRIDKYEEFCVAIAELPRSNFEIGWHGYNHDIWNKKSNCLDREFRELSYDGATEVFEKMSEIAKRAGLIDLFIPVFRPPAFKVSSVVRQYCKDNGIRVTELAEVNVNYPVKPLKLFDKTEILYHACEWDRSYFSVARAKDLRNFLNKNLGEIEFTFIMDM